MDNATKPTFLNLPSLKLTEDSRKRGASEEETALYAMSNSSGWTIFENFTNQVLKDLDQVNTDAISNGASFEEIGKNTLVISLTKDVITRLLNKVLDAKEVCEGGE